MNIQSRGRRSKYWPFTLVRSSVLALTILSLIGCRNSEPQTERVRGGDPDPLAEQKPVPSRPVPYPFYFPQLKVEEMEHLSNEFPENLRAVLEQAESIQVFETEVCSLKGY